MNKRKLYNYIQFYHIVYIFAAVALVCGIFNMQGSILARDYICVPGYIIIDNVDREWTKHGSQMDYEYTIYWTSDGIDYERHAFSHSKPDENLSEVWVATDNSDAVTMDPRETGVSGFYYIIGAIIGFVLAFIMKKMFGKEQKLDKDAKESLHFSLIALCVVMVIGTIFCTAVAFFSGMSYGNKIFTYELALIFAITGLLGGIGAAKTK